MPDWDADESSQPGFELPEGLRLPEISRRWALKFGALGIGAFAAAPLLAACGGSSSPLEKASVKGGDLIIVDPIDALSMDKTVVFSTESIYVYDQIYECLLRMTDDGKSVMPQLAESYTMSADSMSYTFKLRSGVKFSDGTPMTSADVKFSIDESSKTKGGWEFINTAIDKITTPDDLTVVIKTKYPWAPLLADVSCVNNGIIPKDYGGKTAKEFYAAPVGTGPFMWDTWVKGSALKLKKNPHYWQPGKPILDSVTWKVAADDNSRALQLQGGQAHINVKPPFSSITQINASPGVKATTFPSTFTDYILMNHRVKPYQDLHVRRAICYAIDREALVKSILFGHGQVANSLLMPTIPYYDKNCKGIQYNMDKARAELKLSSVPDGFTTTWLARGGDAGDSILAQILQASLKELGITMNIRNVDPGAQHDLTAKMQYEITHGYFTMDLPDPDELISVALDPTAGASAYYTGYSDPVLTNLIHQSQRETDPTKRQVIYNKIQQMAADSAYMAFLYYTPIAYGLSDKVKGFNSLPSGYYPLQNVSLTA